MSVGDTAILTVTLSPQKEHISSYHITDDADIHKDFLFNPMYFIYLKPAI